MSLIHCQPRFPAWYTDAGPTDLHISPSHPSVMACSNVASSAAGSVTSAAVVSRSPGEIVIACASAARRRGYGSRVRSCPSAYSSSKQNSPTGTSRTASAIPYLRRRNMTSANGCSSSVAASNATTSPSMIASAGPSPAASTSTTSGNCSLTSSSRRVHSSIRPSAVLWACSRMPSYLYSAAHSPPSLARISDASASRWASMTRTGLPGRTWISSTAASPSFTSTWAIRPRSQQML